MTSRAVWVGLALCLMLPTGQACSLIAEPDGPGEVAAIAMDGSAMFAFDVHERGLGADCRIEIPYAIGGGHMAWIEAETLHVLELVSGATTQTTWTLDGAELTTDEAGLIAYMRDHSTQPPQTHVHAVAWDGTTTILRSAPGVPEIRAGHIIDEELGRLRAWDLRTGEAVIDARPTDSRYSSQDLGPVATDGRYAIFEALGQGRQPTVVWDAMSQTSYELSLDEWLWEVRIVDGTAYGATQHRTYIIDLANGDIQDLGPAPEGILAAAEGWFMTGTYAKEWNDPPAGEGIPGPGIVLVPLLLWAARRPGTKR